MKGESPKLNATAKLELDGLFAQLSSRQIFQVESPERVLSNIERLGENGWLIHLRNLSPTSPIADVRIHFRSTRISSAKVTGYSPQWSEPLDVPLTLDDGLLKISVPAFDSYAGIRISLA